MKRSILKLTFFVVLSTGTLLAQEGDYSIKPISENTEFSDFGVAYFGPNTAVFASSRKGNTIVKRVWSGNKQPFLELYKGTISGDGELVNIQSFSPSINTRYHESNAVFTEDLKRVYFTGDNLNGNKVIRSSTGVVNLQLYTAAVNAEGQWTDIQKLPFNSDEFNTGHPALSPDEKELYFISDRPESLGATDVFAVAIHSDGSFGAVRNLGSDVNTTGREMFPFVDDRNVLYFSSDGFDASLGGLDIYATKIDAQGGTVAAKHLNAPVNSSADDFGLVLGHDQAQGYFSSNRTGGLGDDDIYFIEVHKPLQFECDVFLTGEVLEFGTEKAMQHAWVELRNANGEVLKKIHSDAQGKFELALDCSTGYILAAGQKDYKEFTAPINTSDQHKRTYEQRVYLTLEEFVAVGKQLMIDIKPIYFDLDKYEIRDDAASALDKVVQAMRKYPKLNIELGSHTDSRARDQYNMDLSKKRAQATKQWIVDKGIGAGRISAKGFGESKLVNNCKNGVKCTESEHQMNRRTEFVIVNPEVLKNH